MAHQEGADNMVVDTEVIEMDTEVIEMDTGVIEMDTVVIEIDTVVIEMIETIEVLRKGIILEDQSR